MQRAGPNSGDNRVLMTSSPLSATPVDSAPTLVVSVVSHGHSAQVEQLLRAMARTSGQKITRVILTQNLPEPPPEPEFCSWPFQLELRCNPAPMGFSDNHNAALAGASEDFVCVLNPDVVWLQEPMAALLQAASLPGVGLAYPVQVDAQGRVQDSEREVPTPWSLLLRYAAKRHEPRAEWVNGAMWVLPRPVWQQVGGLDARYFMYCEDVDLCLRVRLAGYTLAKADAVIEHAGQRDSHRRWRNALWHIRSLLRLWTSPVFWRARPLLRKLPASALTMTEQ